MPKVVFSYEEPYNYQVLVQFENGKKHLATVDKFLADRLGPFPTAIGNAEWLAVNELQGT